MKEHLQRMLSDDAVFYSLLVVIIALASFGLGRMSVIESIAPRQAAAVSLVQTPREDQVVQENTSNTSTNAQFVASKNGTKYHRLDCPGAKQMSEQNKIFFSSVEEAASSGYTPAGNCPGL